MQIWPLLKKYHGKHNTLLGNNVLSYSKTITLKSGAGLNVFGTSLSG